MHVAGEGFLYNYCLCKQFQILKPVFLSDVTTLSNVALFKPAYQQGVAHGGVASRAVDGDR